MPCGEDSRTIQPENPQWNVQFWIPTVIHIPDVRQDPDFRLHAENAGEVKALLAAPLLREGRPSEPSG